MSILETDGERLLIAVRGLLAAKGIASPQEIAERIAMTDAANRRGRAHGREGLDRSGYRALMLEDGRAPPSRSALRCAARPARGVGEYAGAASSRGLHAVQLLSARGARLPAVLVQIRRLPRPRCPRPARRAWPMGHASDGECGDTGLNSTADYRWMVLPMRLRRGRRGGPRRSSRDRARGGYDWGDGAGGLSFRNPRCCATTHADPLFQPQQIWKF